jgi:hypothetical protein
MSAARGVTHTSGRSLLAVTACLATLFAGVGQAATPGALRNEAAPFNTPSRDIGQSTSRVSAAAVATVRSGSASGALERGALRNEAAPFNQPAGDS